jgi:undecaprenyl-diphosphatase
MLPLITALIIGFIQGLIEWLPVSSQGQLVLLMVAFLGVEPMEAASLSVYIHLGTGLAALVYFRRDVSEILRKETEQTRRMSLFLIVVTIATGVIGLPMFLFVQTASIFGEALLGLTGIALIATGIFERSAPRYGGRTTEDLSGGEALLLGVVQGFSAVPGVSRSGITTTTLLLRGFSGEEALRISFLLSIPVVFASTIGLYVIEGTPPLGPTYLIAVVASFISALLSMDLLLRVVRKFRFWSLCVILGIVALLPLALFAL